MLETQLKKNLKNQNLFSRDSHQLLQGLAVALPAVVVHVVAARLDVKTSLPASMRGHEAPRSSEVLVHFGEEFFELLAQGLVRVEGGHDGLFVGGRQQPFAVRLQLVRQNAG